MGAATVPLMMLGGGVMSGGAKKQGAQAQSAMYGMQAEQSRRAAAIEKQMGRYNSAIELAQSRRKVEKIGRAGEIFLSQVQTGYSASGVESSSGSAIDVTVGQILNIEQRKAEAAMAGHAKSNMALYKSELAAWNQLSQANVQEFQSQSTEAAGDAEAAGSLLGGYVDFEQTGGWGTIF